MTITNYKTHYYECTLQEEEQLQVSYKPKTIVISSSDLTNNQNRELDFL